MDGDARFSTRGFGNDALEDAPRFSANVVESRRQGMVDFEGLEHQNNFLVS